MRGGSSGHQPGVYVPHKALFLVYFFIYMFAEVQRLINDNTKVFFTRYFLNFYCFLTSIHGISCWVRLKTNMKVFALFKVEQHFPYICPCYCLIYTVLDLFNMFLVCYTSIKFCIISKQFHYNCYNVRHVIGKNQKENRRPQKTTLGNSA